MCAYFYSLLKYVLFGHLGVPSSVGCSSNSDCQPTDSCLNRQCVNPCTVSNPCASTALCTINNHKAVCRCPDGLTGDPFVSCYKGEIFYTM